jgi:8-oxo-dGTP diphosphatase
VPPFAREFPDAPRVGVGAVILDGDRVLLVKRGQPPSQGKWSIPGGLVHLGERIEAALRREVEEECGVQVRLLGLCGWLRTARARHPASTTTT